MEPHKEIHERRIGNFPKTNPLFFILAAMFLLAMLVTAWLTEGIQAAKGAAGAILAVLFLCLTMDAIDYFERRKK